MATRANARRRNILIVMADQLSARFLGCYGHPVVKSPNIDRLAEQGLLYETAYCNSPLCTPARYAFMTGQYVSKCGGYDNAAYMPATMPTFAHYLRLMGYRTCLAGKMHFVGPDQLHGFEERLTTDVYPADFGWIPDWNQPDQRIDLWYHNMSSVKQAGVAAVTNQLAYDDEVGSQALRAIYDHARGTDPRPLLLVTSFIHPHDPYAARREYWDLYRHDDIDMPRVGRPPREHQDPHNLRLERAIALDAVDITAQDIRRSRHAYYANISYVDRWLGRIRGALETAGLAESTAIIFTSDHGEMLGEHGLWYKMSFREPSCRVPLIIRDPWEAESKRVAAPVSHVDILPTLVDLATEQDSSPPEVIDPLAGQSLIPRGRDSANPGRVHIVSEYLGEGTVQPMLMLRSEKFKYTCCPGDPEQLFDPIADPDELDNLAAKSGYATVMSEFRRAADAHWDVQAVRQAVVADQVRRRAVHAALKKGRYQSWDYQPQRDASKEYSRSHLDLTEFDITSRFPRPRPFRPRFK